MGRKVTAYMPDVNKLIKSLYVRGYSYHVIARFLKKPKNLISAQISRMDGAFERLVWQREKLEQEPLKSQLEQIGLTVEEALELFDGYVKEML